MKTLSKSKLLKVLKQDTKEFYDLMIQEWCNANWELLSQFKSSDIKKHPSSEDLHLILASTFQNINDYKKAEKYLHKAMKLGNSLENVISLCFADIYNTRAKISAIKQEDESMEMNFEKSIDIYFVQNHQKSFVQTRSTKELSVLGLFPQALNEVKNSFKSIGGNRIDEKIKSKILILKTEIEILSHELSLSQQRMQLYKTNVNANVLTNSIEDLKSRSVSQLGQDLWVLEQTSFKKNGFFVEFGATDGVLLSNTLLLEKEFGWQGICAEPNPKFYKKLKKNRTCTVSNACIGAITGEVVEFIFAQEFGGMKKHANDDNHTMKRNAYIQENEIAELVTISLHDFLIKMGAPKHIDYLSIDTEGSEYEILKNFPFELWDVDFISVEHNYTENRKKIRTLLENKKYKCIESQWDDWYYKEAIKC